MICPRCKGENTDESTVCSNCGLKLKTACPRCKTLNRIGQPVCANCKLKLIRFCPQCKSPNFPNAKNCRKCNFELLKPKNVPPTGTPVKPPQKVQPKNNIQEAPQIRQESEQVQQAQQVAKQAAPSKQQQKQAKLNLQDISRTEAADSLISLFKKSDQGMIINISSQDGGGKSTLISSVIDTLKNETFIWLIGTCQPVNQLLPYSYFQEAFKSFFGLPLYVSDVEESKETLNKILETAVGISDTHISSILQRILFNSFNECSPNIEENRHDIYKAIEAFLEILSQKSNIVFVIDDIEYIDTASLECLKYLVNNKFLNKKNFLLISQNDTVNINEQFPLQGLRKKILPISFKSMTPEELNSSLLGMMNNQDILPPKVKGQLFAYSKDAPLYMEQGLWYLFQTGAIVSSENAFNFNPQAQNVILPPTLDEIIATRINLISNVSPDAMRVIMSASLFGMKFIPAFVQMLAQVEDQQFNQLVQMLLNNGIFAVVDQTTLRFKHSWIWRVVYEQFFNEDQIVDCGTRLVDFYEKYTTNISNAVLARHAEEARMKNESYIYYNLAVQESIYMGDPATFTDNQNKVLEMLPVIDLSDEQRTERKLAIEEQIGRANYEFKPSLAMEYLSNSIVYEEQQKNIVKVIDLTGYLARSCELTGDYTGVIECCDKALSLMDRNKHQLESILLNYYKLEADFNLGRLEETIVNASNEVIPGLNKFITKNKSISGIDISDLKNIEYEAELTLAKALVFQGNKQAIDLTGSIILKAQKDNLSEYELQAMFLQALFATIQGNTKVCNSILTAIKEKYSDDSTPEKFKLFWYFIAILASVTSGNFAQTREFTLTATIMANIYKDYNLLTLIKLILGKCYEEFAQPVEAFKLYDEVINYCSEKKMATGALYSWYLAANHELKSGNIDKALDIAERAIEITQKPNIANSLAEILMNKLIAKARLLKNDFEGAQINVEIAINAAESNDLTILLVDLYIVFGQIYRTSASVIPEHAENSANVANRLFAKALSFAEQIENHYMVARVDKEISELLTFCKQNNLKLENIY